MITKQLIESCKTQQTKAQEELYRLLSPKIYGICLKYCADKNLANDLFQDAFILLFKKIIQFKHQGSFEGWAKRLTINVILQYFRKQQFYSPINDDEIAEETTDFDIKQTNLNLDYLLELIQELPKQYCLVFNLYVLDGYTHAEIAESLNISVGTSKSNLSRAKQLLRGKIECGTELKMMKT